MSSQDNITSSRKVVLYFSLQFSIVDLFLSAIWDFINYTLVLFISSTLIHRVQVKFYPYFFHKKLKHRKLNTIIIKIFVTYEDTLT